MTMLAAVHVQPAVTVPIAVALMAVTGWYWVRLGATHVPASRWRIRRISVGLMMALIITLESGTSFVDPALDRHRYATVWTAGFVLLLGVIVTAILDVINNLKIYAATQEREAAEGAAQLFEALRQRKAQALDRENNEDELH